MVQNEIELNLTRFYIQLLKSWQIKNLKMKVAQKGTEQISPKSQIDCFLSHFELARFGFYSD